MNNCIVNIGGAKRTLVFGTRALCFIEEATGKSFAEVASKGGLSFVVVAVAAGLSHEPLMRKRFHPKADQFDFSLVEEWMDAMPKLDRPGTGFRAQIDALSAALKGKRAIAAHVEAFEMGDQTMAEISTLTADIKRLTDADELEVTAGNYPDTLSSLSSKIGTALRDGMPGVAVKDEQARPTSTAS